MGPRACLGNARRADGHGVAPGPDRGGGGPGARVGPRGAGRGDLPRPRVRLAHGCGTAQSAERRDRIAAAVHAGLRLPDAARPGGLPGGRIGRRARIGAGRTRRRGRGHRGRPGGDRRHGLPVPGRGGLGRGVVGAGRGGRRRDRAVPDRPRLGRRHAVRPGSGAGRQELRPGRRIPGRGDRVRRRVLRRLAARGAGDGSPAAVVVGNRVGDVRAGGHRSHLAPRQPDRGLRRDGRPRLRDRRRPYAGRPGGPPADRERGKRGLGPGGVHVRPGGAGGDRGHGVLVVAGRAAPGGERAAVGGMRPGPRRRGDHDVHAGLLPGVLPAARAVRGRPLQGVRGHGGRDGRGRGRGPAPGRAAVGRPARRACDPGRRTRLGGEPGRRVERLDRAERSVAAAGDPGGAGRCRAVGGRCGRGGGARDRDDAG
ncbi:hypothetical protein EHYA_10416 [Embleya hyalina]|uniref:Uncharacterized protein n=1 Tax=Embleya hyalina TaxID=516124 RepID=A0A401Z6Z7_9ACTN|nr:hypothetical protein EHYA_10416 [Embleya hyalina]